MSCKNCGNEFVGNYCNECGQKVMSRLTIKRVWTLIVDDVFEINNGLLYTLRQLWVNPGKVSYDYVNGRTNKFYSPLKYLIFWTAVYFILTSLFVTEYQGQSIREILFNTTKPFSGESIPDFVDIWSQLIYFHINLFFLGMIPFLTILSYVIYRKRKFYMTELSILYLYILGQVTFVIAITIPAISLLGESKVILILVAFVAATIIYLVIKSHKQFFGETWFKSSLKGLVILYIGQLIYMLTMLIIFNFIKMFEIR